MLFKKLAIFVVTMLMLFGAAAGFAAQDCPEKSLFVNISSERVRAVQVGLLVAMANAGGDELEASGGPGQEADVQLFFADAAAPYVLNLSMLDQNQTDALNLYLSTEFGYTVADIERLQEQNPDDDDLPGIFFLQDEPPFGYSADVYACTMCVMETLGAIGAPFDPQDPSTLMTYLIEGAELMTPDNFYVIYDRKDPKGCHPTAAVISY